MANNNRITKGEASAGKLISDTEVTFSSVTGGSVTNVNQINLIDDASINFENNGDINNVDTIQFSDDSTISSYLLPMYGAVSRTTAGTVTITVQGTYYPTGIPANFYSESNLI